MTAANTLTGQKVTTSSDLDGSYALRVPAFGRYVVRAEMPGFAPVTQEVVVHADTALVRADLNAVLQSRAPAAPAPGAPGAQRAMIVGNSDRTATQPQLASTGESDTDTSAREGNGFGISDTATESVAVAGSSSASTTLAGMSTAEMQQRFREFRDQRGYEGPGGFGGGFGGPGDRGFGGAPAPGGGGGPVLFVAGGRGRMNLNQPHGSVYYSLADSALDAAPYALTPSSASKPSYTRHSFGGTIGGPLNIPKLYHGGGKTFFFVSYNGSRGDTPFDAFSTVPTPAERQGIFRDASGNPLPLFDPVTHQPLGAGPLPISPAAQALLPFIPQPNVPGTDVNNFHFVTSASNDTDNLNIRIVHALGKTTAGPRQRGRRNSLTFGFRYHAADNAITNPIPSVGGDTKTRSFDVPLGYIRSFGKFSNILRFDFNRNTVNTQNLYAFAEDIAQAAGISGVSNNPFDWGIPSLSFTHFAGVRDTTPLLQRDQTASVSDFLIWNHGKHTLRWGGDFRRIQHNTETDSNARGSFVFTGAATAQFVNGAPVPGTGFDFADFLLGYAQMTSVQFGANDYHFRGNSWDLFVQDDWRLRGNLTLDFGLRYEYVSPYTEINNLISNLDIAPGFAAVVPVLPCNVNFPGIAAPANCQTGPFTGSLPASLLRPDRNNFAPRLGLAWKPFANTVVRAGYGINYNTTAYAAIAQQLAFQPPFSTTQTKIASSSQPLTLANGFPASPPQDVTNNYAVDPNYRLGYVQIWNLDVQRELTKSLLLNVDYTGTKGTRLDIVDDPNRTATGLLLPGIQPFLLESSLGDSIAHAGTVRLRKRLQSGIAIGGSYTYSKSIDNASTIGGGAVVVAQEAFDLAAERGPSSFDQTHRFTADYLWELPFGHDKRWLAQKSALRDLFGDWQWSGDWTIASGLPFTARVLGDFADVNRGTNGTIRADYNGLPISLPDPTIAEWFNTAAFTAPVASSFGTAGRNTIRGPGSAIFNMAFTKVFPMGDVRVLEFRAQATNIFNTPEFTTIDTVVNSPTFGRVVAVGQMRSFQLVTRFRF